MLPRCPAIRPKNDGFRFDHEFVPHVVKRVPFRDYDPDDAGPFTRAAPKMNTKISKVSEAFLHFVEQLGKRAGGERRSMHDAPTLTDWVQTNLKDCHPLERLHDPFISASDLFNENIITFLCLNPELKVLTLLVVPLLFLLNF